MLKKEFIISVILLVFYVSICYFLTYNNMKLTTISTDNIPLSGKKPNEIPIARLIIKDYNINQYIYDIDSRENNVERPSPVTALTLWIRIPEMALLVISSVAVCPSLTSTRWGVSSRR